MKLIIGIMSLILFLPSRAAIKCYVCHKDISNCTDSPPPQTLLRDCDEDVSACFTQADQIIVRGCFHRTTAISLRAFTRLCTKDGCNDEPFVSRSKLKCALCTAQGCQKQLVECNHSMLLYRRDFCYSQMSSDGRQVLKGCLFEADEYTQRQCNPMDAHRDACVTCQYDGCNWDLVPPASTKCMSTLVKAGVDCRSYKVSRRLGCFARDINGRLELGCNTQKTEGDFWDCSNAANNTCQLCMTSMCNKLEQNRLQACAFGTSDSPLVPKLCRSATDRCVLYSAYGQTLYNCESSSLCLTDFCYFCHGHMCNYNLQPTLSCHKCNSSEACGQELTIVDEYKHVCRLERGSGSPACYSVIDEHNQIHRGCYAETPTICDRFSAKCLRCTENYCNRQQMIKSALVCFSCTPEDRQCAIERSTRSVTTKCLDHFEGQAESCYDLVDRQTIQVERGCALDMAKVKRRSPSALFSYCDTHFCNSQGHAMRKCLSCSGDTLNSSCHSLGSEAAQMVTQCRTVSGQMEASTCYTVFWNRTAIRRGCQVNLTQEENLFCRANGMGTRLCHLCTEDTCNRKKLWYESCFVCRHNCTQQVGVVRGGGNETMVEGNETVVGVGTFEAVVSVSRTCESVSTEDRNGCFLEVVDGVEGKWRQGCVADMKVDEYKTCLADEINCQICTGGSCNNRLKEEPKLVKAVEEVGDASSRVRGIRSGWWIEMVVVMVGQVFWVLN